MNSTSTMTSFECVGQFHEIFGHPKSTTLQTNIIVENSSLIHFRLDLIREEFNELVDAVNDNDIIEVIDAISDIEYVIHGMAHVMGINADAAFLDVHNENITTLGKAIESKAMTNFERVGEFHVLIDHPTSSVFQKNIIKDNPSLIYFRIDIIKERFNDLIDAVNCNDISKIPFAIGKMLHAVYGMAHVIGYNADVAFAIVHASNMSKLCKTEDIAKETIEHYKTLEGFEKVTVDYRLASDNQHYVVFNADTGKILKSKYFTLPDFSSMIN